MFICSNAAIQREKFPAMGKAGKRFLGSPALGDAPASDTLLKHSTQRGDGEGMRMHWEGVGGSKLSLHRQEEEEEELRCEQGPHSEDVPVPRDAHHSIPGHGIFAV